MKVCKRVLFTGTVQGVGFRYTTKNIAARFAVTGFVRNLADGSVELVAEGDGDEIDAFVKAIQVRMDGYIRDARLEDGESPRCEDFQIRR